MKALARLTLVAVFSAWLALPGVGSDGGENAGGTGVWILPRANFLASIPCTTATAEVRAACAIPSVAQSITVTTSSDLGVIVATLVDPVTGVPMPLATSGHDVVIPGSMLQNLRVAGCGSATIVIADDNHLGYVIEMSIDLAAGAATLKLF